MHILQVTSEFPPHVGGVANHVRDLSLALSQCGLDITVVAPNEGDDTETYPGIDVLRPRTIRARPFYDWHLGHQLSRIAKAKSVDMIHVHGLRPLRAALATGLPVTFTNHTSGFLKGLTSARRRKTYETLFPKCALHLAPSDELATYSEQFSGKPCIRQTNAVDAERFKPDLELRAQTRRELGLSDDQVMVILARRLVEKNGIGVLADGLRSLDRLPVTLVVAGDGELRPALEGVAANPPEGMVVHMLGAVPNHRMNAFLNAADLALLPSLMEATSIAGLEAMACGVPVLGTDTGGIPEIVLTDHTGWLVPTGDGPAFAKKLQELVEQPGKLASLRETARDFAKEGYSWGSRAADLKMHYANALSGSAAQ
ncbi:glycosyltransferase family 4 protein [Coralliovum pocilloporae]|uniref:glycosyltransferase family 4 protein n=1 Tax=Coralliovum pocilloporae TaxID=3066369 RepID=UPI003306A496